MSVSSSTSQPISRRGFYSDLLVILITFLALMVGWVFKTSVENRSLPFDQAGVQAQTPQGWLNVTPAGNEILHVTDLSSNGFGTTYIVEKILVEKGSTFGQAASLLTLERGQALTAFRVLDQKEITISGRQAYEINYVYVESNPNLTHNVFPNIVRGTDTIFLTGDQAIVVTFWADMHSYESDLGRFQVFLRSLKF